MVAPVALYPDEGPHQCPTVKWSALYPQLQPELGEDPPGGHPDLGELIERLGDAVLPGFIVTALIGP